MTDCHIDDADITAPRVNIVHIETKMRRRKPHVVSLADEATILAPLLQVWSQMSPKVNDFDLVGSYILTTLAIRNPSRYLSSFLPTPVVSLDTEEYLQSTLISRFVGLTELLDPAYLHKKLKILPEELTIAQIFNRYVYLYNHLSFYIYFI